MIKDLDEANNILEESKHYLDSFDSKYIKDFMNNMSDFYDDDTTYPFKNVGIAKEIQVKIAYNTETKTIKIAFECSRKNRVNRRLFNVNWDWLGNLLYFPTKCNPYKDMNVEFETHLGFTMIWKSVEDYIKDQVSNMIRNHADAKNIWIFGWSQGGATAQFCHEFCRYNFPTLETTTMTVGSPRILCTIKDPLIKADVVQRFKRLVMFANNNDIVPTAPFDNLGFSHIVPLYKVGKKFNFFKMLLPWIYHLKDTYMKEINKLTEDKK